jgi:hypothetical protein
MVKEALTVDDTIEFLNSLLELDRAAVTALFFNRVMCKRGSRAASYGSVWHGDRSRFDCWAARPSEWAVWRYRRR